jgi:hypothetical protein
MAVRERVANNSQKSPRAVKFLLTKGSAGRIVRILFPEIYWNRKLRKLKYFASEYEMRIARRAHWKKG